MERDMDKKILQYDNTLDCLPRHAASFQLSTFLLHQLCHKISEAFEKKPSLPGVFLFDNHKLHSMVSRSRFFEILSRLYRKELFWEYEIREIAPQFATEHMILPIDTFIGTAVEKCLNRKVEFFSEPVIVEDEGTLSLIDVHVLLKAHAHIFSKTIKSLQNEVQRSSFLRQKLYEAHQAAEKTARLDGLTGIPNRRSLDEYLAKECQRAVREKSFLSLILIDIDYFKAFNDTYGHQAGDDVLVQVAKCLSRKARRPADMVARYGGEEFIVILPDTPLEGAFLLAEKMRLAVSDLQIPNEKSVNQFVSISCGISSVNPQQKGSNIADFTLQMADKALYEAKNNGRNMVMPSPKSLRLING